MLNTESQGFAGLLPQYIVRQPSAHLQKCGCRPRAAKRIRVAAKVPFKRRNLVLRTDPSERNQTVSPVLGNLRFRINEKRFDKLACQLLLIRVSPSRKQLCQQIRSFNRAVLILRGQKRLQIKYSLISMVPESILRMPALRARPFPILENKFKMKRNLFAIAELVGEIKCL